MSHNSLQRGVHDDEIKTGFYAKTETCTESENIEDLLERMKLNVLNSLETFESRGNLSAPLALIDCGA